MSEPKVCFLKTSGQIGEVDAEEHEYSVASSSSVEVESKSMSTPENMVKFTVYQMKIAN